MITFDFEINLNQQN